MRRTWIGVVVMLMPSATLPHAQAAEGRVVDEHGVPLQFVHVFRVDSAGRPSGPSALTGPDGSYRLFLGPGASTRVAFRRIGLYAEPPLELAVEPGVTLRLDRIMRQVPVALDVQEIRALRCDPIDASSGSGFDALLASAREQERLRETFREAYQIRVRATGHRFANGQRIPTDTEVVWTPPVPPIDSARARERLVKGTRPGILRRGSVSFWSPTPRLFLSVPFLKRFCADSIRTASADHVTLFAHERGGERTGASWTATVSRQTGMLELLEFTFRFDGLLVGRARHEYALESIGGGTLPLERRVSISQLDPRSGRVLWDAATHFAYVAADRVVR